jgi:hypothetical protein
METKVCSKCQEEKKVCDFYKDKSRKDGFYLNCKKCEKIRFKIYCENNKEKLSEKYKKDKEKNPNYLKEWRLKNPNYNNEYEKNRRLNDPIFYLRKKVRNRLRDYLRYKTKKTSEYLGCSFEELKFHLETLFTDGMSWENRNKWHIDHIIPLSSAKTEEELYKLCHYTNLQPLWAEDNLKKSNKIFTLKNIKIEKNIIS